MSLQELHEHERPSAQEYLTERCIPCPTSGCWHWTMSLTRSGGYGGAWFLKQPVSAHRLSYMAFNGPIVVGEIQHTCDVPSCINPDHLIDGDHYQNMQDCVARGRHAGAGGNIEGCHGEHNGNSKLTADQVRQIRKDTRPPSVIAAEYGVLNSAICKIQKRRTWRNIQ